MNINFINPKACLTNFFTINNLFGFHDQTQPENNYSYGVFGQTFMASEPLKNDKTFHLTTSTEGAAFTSIIPNIMPNESNIEQYINTHFCAQTRALKLSYTPPNTAYSLQFIADNEKDSYQVALQGSKTELTHEEANQVVKAIQGTKNTVNLICESTFTVSSKITASLTADWLALLTLCIENKYSQTTQIQSFLAKEIVAQKLAREPTISQQLSYKNKPSSESIASVSDNLLHTAATLMSNTLQGITTVHELPDKVSYNVCYSNSLPQTYQIQRSKDFTELFSQLDYSKVVSNTTTPLPEPKRKPITPVVKKKKCEINLGFDVTHINIMSIEIQSDKTKVAMSWPNFNAITMMVDDTVTELTVETKFSNYRTLKTVIPFQPKVLLQPKSLGFNLITFDACSLEEGFKKISGKATFIPQRNNNNQTFEFNFPRDANTENKWKTSWMVNTFAADFNGHIEYEWQGKKKSWGSSKYESPSLTSTQLDIKLNYPL
ncbi:hypothetical protein AADZ91_02910 [Colwelliaceae bacterium 6441]